ncbi:hypothetical protein [Pseudoclavibacter sp. CFCC 14310]|uniref:hypothetical protein n=1 Tax=Pseudoclavibacter sp. CFCC 14310 TaxID=2615180 RepID=UPI001787C352|nr:hypothetical protein [Pseudoclavibacter sp. CFCC 14310]
MPYLYAAAICTTIINDGGPGWLYLLILLIVWNAFKFLWIGPVSVLQLASARARSHRRCLVATRGMETAAVSAPATILES